VEERKEAAARGGRRKVATAALGMSLGFAG
jgi:hypothetical protein